jgi:hypothetical protein
VKFLVSIVKREEEEESLKVEENLREALSFVLARQLQLEKDKLFSLREKERTTHINKYKIQNFFPNISLPPHQLIPPFNLDQNSVVFFFLFFF